VEVWVLCVAAFDVRHAAQVDVRGGDSHRAGDPNLDGVREGQGGKLAIGLWPPGVCPCAPSAVQTSRVRGATRAVRRNMLLLSWAQNYAKRARPRTVRAQIVTARVAFCGGQILTLITIVTGFVYPTVWVLGEEGLEAFDINVETGVTVMADLMSKVWALYCARPPRPLSLCLPPSSVRTSCSRGVNDASMRLACGTAQG